MNRLILACLGLLLTGTDPAPTPAPNSKLAEVYTLRFEEKGFDVERPLPAGQKPVDVATLEDKLIVSTDVEIRPGGFTSTGVRVHPDGDIEEHRRTVFEVTLLEKTKDELEE